MFRPVLIITLIALPLVSGVASGIQRAAGHVATGLMANVKTYKVILSKSDAGSNRTVYIQAEDSDGARKQARDQNPGWQVESVEESR